VKAVFFSDAHADHVTYGVRRAPDVAQAMNRILRHAVDVAANFVGFAGDLSDPEDGPAALHAVELLAAMDQELTAEGIPLVAVAGNHDVIEDGSGRTVLSPLRPSMGFHLHETPRAMSHAGSYAGFNVVALPFAASSHAYDPAAFVDSVRLDNKFPTFVISHLAVPGVQPGEETKEIPRGREVVYPFAAVADLMMRSRGPVVCVQGHYHRRQTFRAPQGYDIHIPGSLARLTLGEERHDPGFLVIEI
jgi:Calcineurin-like phosphoesterase superfamily domain